jgi:hypothetical protein
MRAFEEGLADRLRESLLRGLWRRRGGSVAELVAAIEHRRRELGAVLEAQGEEFRAARRLVPARSRFAEAKLAGQRAGATITVEAGVGTSTAPVRGLLR